jgi:hypothetical protein
MNRPPGRHEVGSSPSPAPPMLADVILWCGDRTRPRGRAPRCAPPKAASPRRRADAERSHVIGAGRPFEVAVLGEPVGSNGIVSGHG